jgi:hypothetical protein
VLILKHSEPRGTSPYFQQSWIAAGQTKFFCRQKKTFPHRMRSGVQILAMKFSRRDVLRRVSIFCVEDFAYCHKSGITRIPFQNCLELSVNFLTSFFSYSTKFHFCIFKNVHRLLHRKSSSFQLLDAIWNPAKVATQVGHRAYYLGFTECSLGFTDCYGRLCMKRRNN